MTEVPLSPVLCVFTTTLVTHFGEARRDDAALIAFLMFYVYTREHLCNK